MAAWLGNEANRETADADAPDLVRWVLLRDGAAADSGVLYAPSPTIGALELGFANGFRMALLTETADGRLRVHQSRYTAAGWLEPAEAGSLTGEDGFLACGEDCVTSVPGIFAAGDCRSKEVRQLTTACADGACAAVAAAAYCRAH